jgi:hypothetical protein
VIPASLLYCVPSNFFAPVPHPQVYSRPSYESGCLGTLEEKCFSNKILERDHGEGTETILLGFEWPLFGITKGVSKTQVYEKLGMPARYNKA